MVKQAPRRRYRPPVTGASGPLSALFPVAENRAAPRGPARTAVLVAAYLVAIAAGAVVLVVRIGGRSPLDSIWAEDGTVFLPWALAHPWQLFVPYAGYLELLPRLIGQLAASLPVRDAATVFTISGVVVDSAAAVFVWHASAGHVRSGWLRTLLPAAVLLLSIAPLEIADSGVNAAWYLLFALFWAALWRPQTRSGMALAALIGFLSAATEPLSVIIAPLFLLRLIALRRVREHAVTAGWAAGLLLQLPVMHSAHRSRLGNLAPFKTSLGFYLHDVVLRFPGWRLSWSLESALGRNGATVLVGIVLAVLLGAIVVLSGARIRIFTAAAVGTGFLLAITGATVSNWVGVYHVFESDEPGSRYTALPTFLLEATLIVAVDALLTRARERRSGYEAEDPDPYAAPYTEATYAEAPYAGAPYPEAPYPEAPYAGILQEPGSRAGRNAPRFAAVVAVVVLVAGLGAGWVTDFRNADGRGATPSWAPSVAYLLTTCQDSGPGGTVDMTMREAPHRTIAIPCANIRG